MNYTLHTYSFNEKHIFHFVFDDRIEMNKTFIRFSEYIENPTLEGTIFTPEEAVATFPEFYEKVLGHNIPGNKFHDFIYKYIGHINTRENIIKMAIYNSYATLGEFDGKDFYIIASYKTDEKKFNALRHEMAHAMWYLLPEYRSLMKQCMFKQDSEYAMRENLPFFRSLCWLLRFKRYGEQVWIDEMHAFLVDLSAGETGLHYGRTWKERIKRLFKGQIRFHFKYKKTAALMKNIYNIYIYNFLGREGQI